MTPNTILSHPSSRFHFYQLFQHVLSENGAETFISEGKKADGEVSWNFYVDRLDSNAEEFKSQDEENGITRGPERKSYTREALLEVVYDGNVALELTEAFDLGKVGTRVNDLTEEWRKSTST